LLLSVGCCLQRFFLLLKLLLCNGQWPYYGMFFQVLAVREFFGQSWNFWVFLFIF
jgi:hypothetical protein